MKKQDIRTIKNLSVHLNGLKVEVLRQSKRTGGYTVRLMETSPDAPAYPVGTEMHVSGYELERLPDDN